MAIASEEIRILAIEARSAGGTIKAIASLLRRSRNTISRWLKQYKETGQTKPCCRGHRPASLSVEQLSQIEKILQQQPDLTLEQIKESLSLKCHLSTVDRAVKRLGYRYKKNFASGRART